VPLSATWTDGFQGKSRTALEVRKQNNWTCSQEAVAQRQCSSSCGGNGKWS
jgi:hypothetical protein